MAFLKEIVVLCNCLTQLHRGSSHGQVRAKCSVAPIEANRMISSSGLEEAHRSLSLSPLQSLSLFVSHPLRPGRRVIDPAAVEETASVREMYTGRDREGGRDKKTARKTMQTWFTERMPGRQAGRQPSE